MIFIWISTEDQSVWEQIREDWGLIPSPIYRRGITRGSITTCCLWNTVHICICVGGCVLICETVGLFLALTVALKKRVIPAGFTLFHQEKLTIIFITRCEFMHYFCQFILNCLTFLLSLASCDILCPLASGSSRGILTTTGQIAKNLLSSFLKYHHLIGGFLWCLRGEERVNWLHELYIEKEEDEWEDRREVWRLSLSFSDVLGGRRKRGGMEEEEERGSDGEVKTRLRWMNSC